MKRTYEKPLMAVHHIETMMLIATSGYILLNDIQSDIEIIEMENDEIPPGEALSRELLG